MENLAELNQAWKEWLDLHSPVSKNFLHLSLGLLFYIAAIFTFKGKYKQPLLIALCLAALGNEVLDLVLYGIHNSTIWESIKDIYYTLIVPVYFYYIFGQTQSQINEALVKQEIKQNGQSD